MARGFSSVRNDALLAVDVLREDGTEAAGELRCARAGVGADDERGVAAWMCENRVGGEFVFERLERFLCFRRERAAAPRVILGR